jgi:hypothetical protein
MKQLSSYQANTKVNEDQTRITAVLFPARIRKTLFSVGFQRKENVFAVTNELRRRVFFVQMMWRGIKHLESYHAFPLVPHFLEPIWCAMASF